MRRCCTKYQVVLRIFAAAHQRCRLDIRQDSEGGFTQNLVTAYDPAYDQRQSSHMQQECHHRQHQQSGLLKTILSKPEAGRNRENSP